ncbi:DUF4321 domain-containing protein [Clostridium niameyense]|uniref:DUF4321 domain-containing protein n=1 Tax=Clostridium niameyense TaxID=1622073 RepID=A0A6M0R8U1_9CLOT|nr:DUF4321 domain-containing protein [Clostridium niameyense]NEZ45658.1 DUF4321 domain-containing protein [Clostridium niameyense]
MKSPEKNKNLFGVFILLGSILGTISGEIIGNSFASLAFLKNSYKIGTSAPLVLNLKILNLTLGINFDINIMTIIGVILSIILYRK